MRSPVIARINDFHNLIVSCGEDLLFYEPVAAVCAGPDILRLISLDVASAHRTYVPEHLALLEVHPFAPLEICLVRIPFVVRRLLQENGIIQRHELLKSREIEDIAVLLQRNVHQRKARFLNSVISCIRIGVSAKRTDKAVRSRVVVQR